MRLSPGSAATVALLSLIGLLWPAWTPPAAAAGPETVTVTGSGWGHGRGLSQYGAQNRAKNHAMTAAQILDFYYPGTAATRVGGSLRVLLTADTTANVVVAHRAKLTVRSVQTGKTWSLKKDKARRWKLTARGTTKTRLSVKAGKRGWRVVRDIPGQAEFKAKGGSIRLYVPGGSAEYRGRLRSAVPDSGVGRDTVNVVGLDKYLRGVVPAEVPATWHPHAVQAQSVAARTYAVFERAARAGRYYDLCDTTACQVYRGTGAEHPASDAAIRATAGQIRTYGGKPAFTQFSSSNGGWTAAGSLPYQQSRQDTYDTWAGNPNRQWQVVLTDDEIEASFPGIGDFEAIQITADPSAGGRVSSVRVVGASRTTDPMSGDAFRVRFGLKSTVFSAS